MISPIQAALSLRVGTKPTLLIGSLLVSVGWLTASFATEVWHLFLTVGGCFGWGMGLVYITAAAILPQWFSSRRSLAVGIAASGAGLGGLFYSLLTGYLVQKVGVSWTYRVLACITIVMNGGCAILMRDRNKMVRPVRGSFSYRELGHVEVLLIIAWGFVTDIGYVVLLFSLPHFAESIGLSQTQGSIVGAMLSLGLAIGRPLVGYYSDALGRINMAGLMTALCGLLCLAIWVPAKSFAVLIVFAIPAGAVTGIFWGTYGAEAISHPRSMAMNGSRIMLTDLQAHVPQSSPRSWVSRDCRRCLASSVSRLSHRRHLLSPWDSDWCRLPDISPVRYSWGVFTFWERLLCCCLGRGRFRRLRQKPRWRTRTSGMGTGRSRWGG